MAASPSVRLLTVAMVLNVLALFFLGLRFHARRLQKAVISMDDYTLILAVVFAVGLGVSNSIGAAAVVGDFGMEDLQVPDRLLIFTKTDFAGILMSIACLAFVKFSIVSFFRRIFRGKVFGRITLVLLIVNAAWGVTFVLAVLLQCVPVSGAWDKVTREHAVCYNPVPTFYGVAISDTILDVVILVLPQPFTWRLHMPMRQKLAVSGIFLVGIFVLGVSAARIHMFFEAGKKTGHSENVNTAAYALPLDTLTPLYWTHIECTVAVICACLPSLRTIWLDAAVGNLKSLRSWASKKSLRSSSKGTRQGSFGEGSEPSLPRFEESAGKAESLSSAHRASSQDHKSSPQYNVKGTN